jgi:ribosome-associated protein
MPNVPSDSFEPGAAHTAVAPAGSPPRGPDADALEGLIVHTLDEDKAEDILSVDLRGKSSLADRMVIASGRSSRHVAALAAHVVEALRDTRAQVIGVEGLPHGDWVVIDAVDVIVHLFRPEVRSFYNIERIWGVEARAALPPAGAYDSSADDAEADLLADDPDADDDDDDLID